MNSFATHDVFNQSQPLTGHNLFSGNQPLRSALALLAPQIDTRRLLAFGAELGTATMQLHARLANQHPPQLHTHDAQGQRIDQVEFHASYHHLLGHALQHGLHGAPWAAGAASKPAGAHIERAAAFMLSNELEVSVLCPVSMSYAVLPALQANAPLMADWGHKLTACAYDPRFVPIFQKSSATMGMGMTEKQGGSDVRANTTRAEFEGADDWGRRYAITGHKWFFSAPMCDAFLLLAQAPAGLTCFFMPRFDLNGELNSLHIQRLKNKLGNRANASSEVEFHAARAWLVGDEGRGIAQILTMGALTRLDCALGTAGLMRQALGIALNHCSQRLAFGKPLVDQPLMQNVLADLALESEAATALALRLAAAVDRTAYAHEQAHAQPAAGIDAGHEKIMRRLLTPVAKFWICKRGSHFAQEAMECLGGNGYVEATGMDGSAGAMARNYRDMPLNSIWEGAGNIMALDLLRALRGADVAAALEHEWSSVRGRHRAFDGAADALLLQIDGLVEEPQARRLARDLALLQQAACLSAGAPPAVFEAFCASRLAQASDVFGVLPAGTDFSALIERARPAAALSS